MKHQQQKDCCWRYLFVYVKRLHGYIKENISWKPIMHFLDRNPQDVSILFSVGDYITNTRDHYDKDILPVKLRLISLTKGEV